MDQDYGTVSGEKEAKRGGQSNTSGATKSRKTGGMITSPEDLLKILTQASRDIFDSQECQERGIKVRLYPTEDGVLILVLGSQLNQERVIVPRMPRTSDTNQE